MLGMPVLALAQNQTPPGTPTDTGITYECTSGKPGDCTFNDLILAVKKVINWGTGFALGFTVVIIAYAGFLYMLSGENAGERKKANTMLTKAVIGIAYIVGAWLIVNLIITGLGVSVNTFMQ